MKYALKKLRYQSSVSDQDRCVANKHQKGDCFSLTTAEHHHHHHRRNKPSIPVRKKTPWRSVCCSLLICSYLVFSFAWIVASPHPVSSFPAAFLLLPASAATLQQRQLCPSANTAPSLTAYTIINNAAFVGNRCLYANFTMTVDTAVGNTSEAIVDITGGTVLQGTQNGIFFKGFTVVSQAVSDLGDRGRLRIAVRNVTFLAATVLKFDRLFPNNTNIVVEGNTFVNLVDLVNVGGSPANGVGIGCIIVDFSASGTPSILYTAGFSLVIENNTATLKTLSRAVAIVCIVHQSSSQSRSLTFGGNATLLMNGNTLVNSATSNAYAVYVYVSSSSAFSSSIMIQGNGTMVASGNGIASSTFTASACVVYVWVRALSSAASHLTIEGNGSMTISDNVMSNNSVASNAYAVWVSVESASSSASARIDSNGAMIVSGNAIRSSVASNVYLASVRVSAGSSSTSALAIKGNSAMIVSGNTLINSTVRLIVYVVYVDVRTAFSALTVDGSASLFVSGNGIVSSFTVVTFVVQIYVYASVSASSMTIKDNSSLIVNNNAITNGSATSDAIVVSVAVVFASPATSSDLAIAGNGSVIASGNTVTNSSLMMNAYVVYLNVRAAASSSVRMESNSSLRLNANAITNSNVTLVANVVSMRIYVATSFSSLAIKGNSSMIVSGNSITGSSVSSVACVADLIFDSPSSSAATSVVIEGNNASMRIENNMLRLRPSTRSNLFVAFRLMYNAQSTAASSRSMTVSNQSSLSITGNSILFEKDADDSSQIGSSASALTSFSKTTAIFEAAGAFELTVEGLLAVSNNTIGNVVGCEVRIVRFSLNSNATRPSRIFAIDSSAPLSTRTSGLAVNGNAIRHATVQCGDDGSTVSHSSSLSTLSIVGGVLRLEGTKDAALSVTDNVVSHVLFTPKMTSPSSSPPPCSITFSMVRLSANLVCAASVALLANQITAVHVANMSDAAQQQQQLSMDAKASGGCLLTVNGTVSFGGGSELTIATNDITAVNASRSIAAFTSNVSITQDGRLAIRGNTVTYTPVTLTATTTSPWGGGPRSLLWMPAELHWRPGWNGLRITDNVITSVPSSSTFPDPSQWVLFDNSEGSVRGDATESNRVVLCPNDLFGSNQDLTVVEITKLLADPAAFNAMHYAPTYECLKLSKTLPLINSPTFTPSSDFVTKPATLTIKKTRLLVISITETASLSALSLSVPAKMDPKTAAPLKTETLTRSSQSTRTKTPLPSVTYQMLFKSTTIQQRTENTPKVTQTRAASPTLFDNDDDVLPPALPAALEALADAGAREGSQTIGSVSTAAAVIADPITLLQLDAVASVMEMAVCSEGSLDWIRRDKYDFSNNPLHIFLSAGGAEAANANQKKSTAQQEEGVEYSERGSSERGALLTCLVILLASLLGLTAKSFIANRRAQQDRQKALQGGPTTTSSQSVPFSWSLLAIDGFPSVFITPVTFVMRMAVRSGTRLALFSELSVDVAMGSIALALAIAYMLHLVFVMLPRVSSRPSDERVKCFPTVPLRPTTAPPATNTSSSVGASPPPRSYPPWHCWLENTVGPSCIWEYELVLAVLLKEKGDDTPLRSVTATAAGNRTGQAVVVPSRCGDGNVKDSAIDIVDADPMLEPLLIAAEEDTEEMSAASSPANRRVDDLNLLLVDDDNPNISAHSHHRGAATPANKKPSPHRWLVRYQHYLTKSRGVPWFGVLQVVVTMALKLTATANIQIVLRGVIETSRASCVGRNVVALVIVAIYLALLVALKPRPVPSEMKWWIAVISNGILLVCCCLNTANAATTVGGEEEREGSFGLTRTVVILSVIVAVLNFASTALTIVRLAVNKFPSRFNTMAPPDPTPFLSNGHRQARLKNNQRDVVSGDGTALELLLFGGPGVGGGHGGGGAVAVRGDAEGVEPLQPLSSIEPAEADTTADRLILFEHADDLDIDDDAAEENTVNVSTTSDNRQAQATAENNPLLFGERDHSDAPADVSAHKPAGDDRGAPEEQTALGEAFTVLDL